MNRAFAFFIALCAALRAATAPLLAQDAGSPVVINSCTPMLASNSNGPTVAGIPLSQTSNGIEIQFTNTSSQTANLINFAVDSNGTKFVIRDVGTFSPNVEVKHRYRNGSGQSFVLPSLMAPNLKCTVESVHFTGGNVWRPGAPGAGRLNASPTRLDLQHTDATTFFMVSTNDNVGAFSERDTCSGIARITLVAAGNSAATFSVDPLGAGSCVATVTDEDGQTLQVPVTVH